MKEVIIASGVRSAIGDFGGALAGTAPCDLATAVASEAILRAGIAPEDVGQTVFGQVLHTEPRDMYVSRVAAIGAGVPETTPALTLNRLCGSGLQAVISAYEQIILGHTDVALAGGVESMSRAGHLLSSARFGKKMGDISATDMMVGALTDPFGNGHMGVTAENVADSEQIDRAAQDALTVESHRRAARAQSEGRFKDQILPIQTRIGRKEVSFEVDEHVRPNISQEDLAKLRPAFRKDGSVTAGNASGINDGAGALVLMTAERAKAAKCRPMARIVSTGLGGVDPAMMGMGPVPAVQRALKTAGIKVEDLSVIESNEAFAAQACAVSARLQFPSDVTNPNGGAIALGHPIGASGAIILVKLLYELQRVGGRYGLATMCIGGGQGIALVVERI